MKYIRTKNMIYQVESILRDNGFVKGYNVGEMAFIKKDQVISQADTIEELCDEFVIVNGKIHQTTKAFNKIIEYFNPYDTFYGAIWTDKGLIYVAKMNETGDLELI